MVHLVYCDDKAHVLDKIMTGAKTMLVRGAAGRKIPHSRVFEGEELYFMEKGSKKISARGQVVSVQNFVKLADEEILGLLEENQHKLALTDMQKERWQKKCLFLVEFGDVQAIDPPLDF
mgnify:FL=1